MVKIPWHTSAQSLPWIPGNEYIDGRSKNFMDGTVEEKGKVKAEGELSADIMRPQGAKGPDPLRDHAARLRRVRPGREEMGA